MTTPLTQDLARFAAGLDIANIPRHVVERICVAFTDCVGVMTAGTREPSPQLMQSVLAPRGDESLLAGGLGRASALDAAFINGVAAHALDFDDDAQRGGHVSAVLVPTILAEGEAVGASGAQMVAAYAVGYETLAELIWRDPGQHHEKGWHPTGVFGAVAAAAACASLRRLDVTQAAMALGLSASQSAGVIANVGTMAKPFHAGHAAHAGVLAARLAAAGFTAAEDVFEHAPGFLRAFSPGGAIDLETPASVGHEWRLCGSNRLGVKQYPLCYYTHRSIDATVDLMQASPVAVGEIEKITVSISPRNATVLRYHLPQTGLEAKFSIEFAVASTILTGQPGLEHVVDAFVLRPEVQALMKRVVVRIEERDDPNRPGYALYDQVIVETRDGRRHESAKVNTIRGGPEFPLAREALWAKFDSCMRYGGTEGSTRRLFDALMALDKVAHVRELVELMTPSRNARPEKAA